MKIICHKSFSILFILTKIGVHSSGTDDEQHRMYMILLTICVAPNWSLGSSGSYVSLKSIKNTVFDVTILFTFFLNPT